MSRSVVVAVAVLLFVGSSAAIGERMYWVDNENLGATKLRSANLDGSDVFNEVGIGGRQLRDIAVDSSDRWIYWSDTLLIARIALPDHPAHPAVERMIDTDHPSMGSPMGIALDLAGGKLYWVDGGDGKIKRIGLEMPAGETWKNRSDVETVVTGFVGLDVFSGIDIPNTASIPAISGIGLLVMVAGMVAAGGVVLRRRGAALLQ